MEIKHRPLTNTKNVEEHYSKKDGVPVKYVCTTGLPLSDSPKDIFFRETPHPEFGNRYFGIGYGFGYVQDWEGLSICNADSVEDLEFSCVNGPEGWEYSKHRHDYNPNGYAAIDGGRYYTRLVGDKEFFKTKTFKVKDGECIES